MRPSLRTNTSLQFVVSPGFFAWTRLLEDFVVATVSPFYGGSCIPEHPGLDKGGSISLEPHTICTVDPG